MGFRDKMFQQSLETKLLCHLIVEGLLLQRESNSFRFCYQLKSGQPNS